MTRNRLVVALVVTTVSALAGCRSCGHRPARPAETGTAAVVRRFVQALHAGDRAAYQALRGFVAYFGYVRDETRSITGFTGPYPPGIIPPTPVDFGEVA